MPPLISGLSYGTIIIQLTLLIVSSGINAQSFSPFTPYLTEDQLPPPAFGRGGIFGGPRDEGPRRDGGGGHEYPQDRSHGHFRPPTDERPGRRPDRDHGDEPEGRRREGPPTEQRGGQKSTENEHSASGVRPGRYLALDMHVLAGLIPERFVTLNEPGEPFRGDREQQREAPRNEYGPNREGPPREYGPPRNGSPREGPPRDGPPRDGPPREYGPPRNGPRRDGPPRDGPPRDGPPREYGPPRNGPHRDGPPRDGPPREYGPPRNGPPRDGPPRDGPPREFGPPRNGPPRDGPPRDGPPRKFGPPRNGPPRDDPPRDGPPRSGPSRDGPPRDGPPRGGPPRDGRPRDDEPSNDREYGPHRSGPPRDYDERQRAGPPSDYGPPRNGPPREHRPDRDGPPRNGPPKEHDPQGQHGPPRGYDPRKPRGEGPPREEASSEDSHEHTRPTSSTIHPRDESGSSEEEQKPYRTKYHTRPPKKNEYRGRTRNYSREEPEKEESGVKQRGDSQSPRGPYDNSEEEKASKPAPNARPLENKYPKQGKEDYRKPQKKPSKYSDSASEESSERKKPESAENKENGKEIADSDKTSEHDKSAQYTDSKDTNPSKYAEDQKKEKDKIRNYSKNSEEEKEKPDENSTESDDEKPTKKEEEPKEEPKTPAAQPPPPTPPPMPPMPDFQNFHFPGVPDFFKNFNPPFPIPQSGQGPHEAAPEKKHKKKHVKKYSSESSESEEGKDDKVKKTAKSSEEKSEESSEAEAMKVREKEEPSHDEKDNSDRYATSPRKEEHRKDSTEDHDDFPKPGPALKSNGEYSNAENPKKKHYDYVPVKNDEEQREDNKVSNDEMASPSTVSTTVPTQLTKDEYATAPTDVTEMTEDIPVTMAAIPIDAYAVPVESTTTVTSTATPTPTPMTSSTNIAETPPKVIDRYNPPQQTNNHLEKSDAFQAAMNKAHEEMYGPNTSNTNTNGEAPPRVLETDQYQGPQYPQQHQYGQGARQPNPIKGQFQGQQFPPEEQQKHYNQEARQQKNAMMPLKTHQAVHEAPEHLSTNQRSMQRYARPLDHRAPGINDQRVQYQPMRDDPRSITAASPLMPLIRPKYANQQNILPNEPVLHQPVSLIQTPWSMRVKIR